MSYTILIGGRARRELEALPNQVIARLDKAISELKNNPRPPGCKKLRSTTPEGWRIRVGDYRVLYRIDDDQRSVTVYRVGHRRDVYD